MTRCLLAHLLTAPLLLTAAVAAIAQTTAPTNIPESVPMQLPFMQQGVRNFPPQAQFGNLIIDKMPDAALNGNPVRTAPGFRLFTPENRLIFAHTVPQQKLQVAYIKEANTDWLLTAWILSPQEISRLTPKR